jgi:hypothetical protein
VDAPEHSHRHQTDLSRALQALAQPTDSNLWVGAGDRQLRIQEAMLSAAWNALNQPDIPRETLEHTLRGAVGRLLEEISAQSTDTPSR